MSSQATLPAGFWPLPLRAPGAPGHVNCFLIGHRQALLVDPGSDYRGELDRLRRRIWELLGNGGVLKSLLLTHHHRDHAAGADRLSDELGVPIAAHPATIERLRPRRRARWLLPIEDGDRLALDPPLELRALHTPGHAAGHLCLLEPQRGILVGGDMVSTAGTTLIDPFQGDMGTYLTSLQRLAALQPDLLLPAHGPPSGGATRLIHELIKHRLWREQRVLESLRSQPRSCAEITGDAYATTAPPFRYWPLAYRSTLAHLLKLEREGRACRAGADGWARADC